MAKGRRNGAMAPATSVHTGMENSMAAESSCGQMEVSMMANS